jgi:hypothetical protein
MLPLLPLLLAISATPAPWADPALPVRGGLLLWLDASHQGPARAARGLPPVRDGGKLSLWLDGSGNGLHFAQKVQPFQPTLVQKGKHAAVRFDGKETFLAHGGPDRSVKDVTLFVVAAPRSNAGFFRALLAGNEAGKNDYTTGFNLDLGPAASANLAAINVEGPGFIGAVNLLKEPLPFGSFATLEIACSPGASGVELVVDGKPAGRRNRAPGALRLDELSVGARFYSNSPAPPFMSGFLDGDVAEVLLYDRLLKDEER